MRESRFLGKSRELRAIKWWPIVSEDLKDPMGSKNCVHRRADAVTISTLVPEEQFNFWPLAAKALQDKNPFTGRERAK